MTEPVEPDPEKSSRAESTAGHHSSNEKPTWIMDNWLWLGTLIAIVALGLFLKFDKTPKVEVKTTTKASLMVQGHWGSSWDQAVVASRRTRRPILIDFTADWCQPCQMMNAKVFPDPVVAETLKSHFVLLRADVTHDDSPGAPLAQKYQVSGIPALFIVDDHGKILASQVGLSSVADFAAWLQDNARVIAAISSTSTAGATPAVMTN